jgi:thiol-disulfide isomerase/thioredoxin
MPRTVLASIVVAAVALIGSSCGSDDSANSAPSTEETDAVAEGTGPIEMTDVATGETQSLDDALAPTDGKPVLAWFWAPFCPTCRGEAPELDEFMADNAQRVKMVGVGTRDDLDQARDFLADTGVTNFPLLWEESGRSWVDNAVAAQPYMILIGPDGEELQRWPGGASVVQIENALAEIS